MLYFDSSCSQIGFEMGEVQEALYRLNGYETIISHIHYNFNPNGEITQESEVICKWATYCLCCCLGDVLEPLEYVKGELKNAVIQMKYEATSKDDWHPNNPIWQVAFDADNLNRLTRTTGSGKSCACNLAINRAYPTPRSSSGWHLQRGSAFGVVIGASASPNCWAKPKAYGNTRKWNQIRLWTWMP